MQHTCTFLLLAARFKIMITCVPPNPIIQSLADNGLPGNSYRANNVIPALLHHHVVKMFLNNAKFDAVFGNIPKMPAPMQVPLIIPAILFV